VIAAQAELDYLTKQEEDLRKYHSHCKGNLQEAWDKLVHLRTHIKLFHSAIEEATIEEVTSSGDSNLSYASHDSEILLTQQSASYASDATHIRDKVRVKEGLKTKISNAEILAREIQQKLSIQTEELGRIISRQTTSSSEPGRTAADPSVSDSVVLYMTKRKQVLVLSQELDAADDQRLKLKAELDFVEKSLNEALRKMMHNQNAEAENDREIDSLLDITISRDNTVAAPDRESFKPVVSSGRLTQDLTALIENPSGSEFTLHEVLTGKARVQRLNGESAKKYKDRLIKRMVSLSTLDAQMQEELEFLAENVRKAKDDVSRSQFSDIFNFLLVMFSVTKCGAKKTSCGA
jgi:hypothetical protein